MYGWIDYRLCSCVYVTNVVSVDILVPRLLCLLLMYTCGDDDDDGNASNNEDEKDYYVLSLSKTNKKKVMSDKVPIVVANWLRNDQYTLVKESATMSMKEDNTS